MAMQHHPRNKNIIQLVLSILIIILIVLISSFFVIRIDLTAEKRYTLSPVTKNILKNLEDVVFVTLRFRDGRMANIHLSWLDPHKLRKITIVGSKKMAVFDDMETSEKLKIYDKGVKNLSYDTYSEYLSLRFGDIVIPSIRMVEPLRAEARDPLLGGPRRADHARVAVLVPPRALPPGERAERPHRGDVGARREHVPHELDDRGAAGGGPGEPRRVPRDPRVPRPVHRRRPVRHDGLRGPPPREPRGLRGVLASTTW